MDSLEILLQKSDTIYTQSEKKELSDRKNRYYQEMLSISEENVLLPGAIKALVMLQESRLKIAIGSSSSNAPQIIKKANIEPYIDAVVCGKDVVNSKPNPEIFLKACEKISVKPEFCLVIEDSTVGIEAAKRAGMKSLGVGYNYKELNADYIAKDLDSVSEWNIILA